MSKIFSSTGICLFLKTYCFHFGMKSALWSLNLRVSCPLVTQQQICYRIKLLKHNISKSIFFYTNHWSVRLWWDVLLIVSVFLIPLCWSGDILYSCLLYSKRFFVLASWNMGYWHFVGNLSAYQQFQDLFILFIRITQFNHKVTSQIGAWRWNQGGGEPVSPMFDLTFFIPVTQLNMLPS